MSTNVAETLLHIGAVEIRADHSFTWASGIQSPIYCDNRLTISYPEVRTLIASEMVKKIYTKVNDVDVIAGAATGGIPHAAWVADKMNVPMVYVRGSAKGHGKQNQIEGRIQRGNRVVVIEDLVSTGGSSLAVVDALQQAGAHVLGVCAIFNYGFDKATIAFDEANIPLWTLTNYETLLECAQKNGEFTEDILRKLKQWDPFR